MLSPKKKKKGGWAHHRIRSQPMKVPARCPLTASKGILTADSETRFPAGRTGSRICRSRLEISESYDTKQRSSQRCQFCLGPGNHQSRATLGAKLRSYGIPSLRRDSHLAHSLRTVREIANVQPPRWIVVVAQLNRGGIEVEVFRRQCLLPRL